jgi:hypothetical protein
MTQAHGSTKGHRAAGYEPSMALGGFSPHLPAARERRRWPRTALGTAATISPGFGILGVVFVLVSGIGRSDRGLWLGLVILLSRAAAGHAWRADVPGRRDLHRERERRGF